MIIQFNIEGGIVYFQTLSEPFTIDTSKIPSSDAQKLENLVSHTHFFNLPDVVGQLSPKAADYQKYTITIKDGENSKTVEIVEPTKDLVELIRFLKTKQVNKLRAKKS